LFQHHRIDAPYREGEFLLRTLLQPLWILFWLKTRLMFNTFRKSVSAVAGALQMLVIFLPISLGLMWLLGSAFNTATPTVSAEVLSAALMGIYFIWLLVPILGYALSDNYDITRLFVYPLTQQQILAGTVLGSLIDIPTLLLLPCFVAIVYGFSATPIAALFTIVALALFLFHMLTLSQAVLLFSSGVLKSRRFRDLAMVGSSMIGVLIYLLSQTMTHSLIGIDWRVVVRSPLWIVANFFPQGMASHAISSANVGDYFPALGWLSLLAVVTALTVVAAGRLLKKVYEGDPPLLNFGERKAEVVQDTGSTVWSRLGDRLPPVVQTIAAKEFNYFRRDPYFKTVLLSLAYVLVVSIFPLLSSRSETSMTRVLSYMPWWAVGLLILSEMQLICNMFGTDGAAAVGLFMFPCSRREIMLGKNLAFFTALACLNLSAVFIVALIAHIPEQLGLLACWVLLSLLVVFAIGNFVSLYFPYRIVTKLGRGRMRSGSQGFGFFVMYISVLFGAMVILLPVFACLVMPMWSEVPIWYLGSIPLAFLYAGGLYALSLYFAPGILMKRELNIAAKVAQPETV